MCPAFDPCSESPLERSYSFRPRRPDCCSTSVYASCGSWSWGGHPIFTDDSVYLCIVSNASLGSQAKEQSRDIIEGKAAEFIIVMVLVTSEVGALEQAKT